MPSWKNVEKKRSMKTDSSVLDASALLSLLKREKGFLEVKKALEAAASGQIEVFINEINLGEVFYVLARSRSLEAARSFFSETLPLLPILPVSSSMEDILAAAELKARFDLHYTDAFAAATASRKKASLLTSDRDFEAVTDEIEIRWLR